jgi:hypothetical protein
MHHYGFIKDELARVATQMAEKLTGKGKDKLQKRVMLGSDWLMTEQSIKGVGPYYSRMFELLRLITVKLKEKGVEYDAWYQFSVLNPMRFLGLLDDQDEINMELLNRHKADMEEKLKDKEWLRKFGKIMKYEIQEIKNKISKAIMQFEKFKDFKLKKAEDIKDSNGKLVLLSYKQ